MKSHKIRRMELNQAQRELGRVIDDVALNQAAVKIVHEDEGLAVLVCPADFDLITRLKESKSTLLLIAFQRGAEWAFDRWRNARSTDPVPLHTCPLPGFDRIRRIIKADNVKRMAIEGEEPG